jgi:hypothetical protein
MSEHLTWETCAGGAAALLHEARALTPDAPVAVRRHAARRRMEGVEALSAAFRGEAVVFEARVTVLVQERQGLRFAGLYASAFPLEGAAPAWCLRTCSWSPSDADRSPGNGLLCRTRFSSPEEVATVGSAAAAFAALARRGIVVERRPAPAGEPRWQMVSAFVADESLHLRISYSAHEATAPALEALVTPWLDVLDRVDFNLGPRADDGLRISYARALP